MDYLAHVILGLVEGITEFLPTSSTGHLILTRALLGLGGESLDLELIVIQGAAILAVCFEYRVRLWATATAVHRDVVAQRFVLNLFVAFLPLAILGLAFEHWIERVLFAPIPVAIALVVGGVLILWAERRAHVARVTQVEALQPRDAFKVGLFQALALMPGTSRSAATILGGLFSGLDRKTATEFSFFVAIPTLLAATFYKLWKARTLLSGSELDALLIGSVVAFASALLAIRLLLRFVSRHSFAVFAWYRIVFGGAILLTWQLGWVAW